MQNVRYMPWMILEHPYFFLFLEGELERDTMEFKINICTIEPWRWWRCLIIHFWVLNWECCVDRNIEYVTLTFVTLVGGIS